MKELVYNYKTKHKKGFTRSEIEALILPFKENLDMNKFNDALRGITCLFIDNKFVIYHDDVLRALNNAYEKSI